MNNTCLYPLDRLCKKDGHQKQAIMMICLDPKCKQNMLCCCTCIDDEHKKHQIISLRKFDKIAHEKLQKNNKDLQKGKISKLFADYSLKFLNSLKSLQNSFLSKIHALENQMSLIFTEVHRTLSQPSHEEIVDHLFNSEEPKDWSTVMEDISLCDKYKIGNAKDTALILQHQYQIFSQSISDVKTQISTKLVSIKNQIKSISFNSLRYDEPPVFHSVFKYSDMARLDNAAIIEKKKNNGNRTIALGSRPLDPINNKVKFRIIKNGDGIPSICIGAAILSIVKPNNFTNCTGYKRGIYGIDQSMTSNWGSVQQSNEATSWNNDLQSNSNNTIGFQFTEGDTVEMTVDFQNGVLIFQMSEEQIYDMDINCSHRDLYPFVGLSNTNSIVQIVE